LALTKEIAYTTLGRNALVIGLIGHVAALLAGISPVSGTESLFGILYGFYWMGFFFAVYKELGDRGYRSFGNWRFYVLMTVTVIPILGPVTALMILYRMQGNKKVRLDKAQGFLSAVLRLRVNMLLIFLFIAILFILFIVVLSRNDPYFKRAKMSNVMIDNQQLDD